MTRVGFYAHRGYHAAVLDPVRAALADRLPSLAAASEDELVAVRPDIVVLPAFWRLRALRRRLPHARIGSVRHGLIAKTVLASLPPDDAARRFDFLCVGDRVTVDAYEAAGAAPTEVWWTGYPQLDPLFRRDPAPDLGLDPSVPTVLFAPTLNAGMSAAPVLGPDVVRLLRGEGGDLNVVIKPHPVIPDLHPEWMAWWHAAAASDARVRVLGPTTDVTAAMLAADVLVSDASSVIFEFLALDRPIVLVTSPSAPSDRGYDPQDLPWAERDVGHEVTDIADLPAAVGMALARPAERAAARERVAARLFGEFRDGRNAERVADHLVDLARRLERGTAPPPAARVQRRHLRGSRVPARLVRRAARRLRSWRRAG